MFRKSEAYCNRGEKNPGYPTRMNEDRFVMAHRTFAVIDGATDRRGQELSGLTPGAYLADYAHRTLNNLAQHPDYADTEAGLILAGMNRAFGEHMQQQHPEVVKDGFHFGPTASLALLRLHEDGTYSYATVGDCFLVVMRTDGSVSVCPAEEKPYDMEKNRLEHFMEVYKESGGTFQSVMENPEAEKMYLEYLEKLNKTFPVLNGDPAMEGLINGGREPLEGVAAFALMSDGMLMPGLPDPEGAHMAAKQIHSHGASTYGKSLEVMYNNDPDRIEHPRFKHRDDMTALYLELNNIKEN